MVSRYQQYAFVQRSPMKGRIARQTMRVYTGSGCEYTFLTSVPYRIPIKSMPPSYQSKARRKARED